MRPLIRLYPLGTNFTKWSNTLKQFVGNLPTNCLSVFDQFVGLALKVLNMDILDNRNITSKYLRRKGVHLNKASSTLLAKNIVLLSNVYKSVCGIFFILFRS